MIIIISIIIIIYLTCLKINGVGQFVAELCGIEFLQQPTGFAEFKNIFDIINGRLDVGDRRDFRVQMISWHVIDQIGNGFTGTGRIEQSCFRNALRLQKSIQH